MRAIRSKGDNPEITGHYMTHQSTFTDIEKARLCFTEYVRLHKWAVRYLDADDDIDIELDDVTDECDPEMIETWSMKEEAEALE